jgi:phosphoglycolate phosphatase-like HAD superfamily hydrolase
MKIVLFDLGETLEEVVDGEDILLPGARETLEAIHAMRDSNGKAPVLALVSDFGDIPANPAQILASQKEYYKLLEKLGIRSFFEPVAQRVTLSTEVGRPKPDKQVFQAVIEKIPGLHLADVMFITEDQCHVQAARRLGMQAIHFKGPRQIRGDIDKLVDSIPHIRRFLGIAS